MCAPRYPALPPTGPLRTRPGPTVLLGTGPKYGLAHHTRARSVQRPRVEVPVCPQAAGLARVIVKDDRIFMASMALHELGRMLTANEVAEILHLHVNTVKRLGDRGELKYYRVCKRGDRRFMAEDVRRFLDQNR